MAAQSTTKQVLLYQNPASRPRLFFFITIASGIQCTFWSYLAVEAVKDYRQKLPEKYSDEQASPSQNTAKGALLESIKEKASSLKWRLGISLLALTCGGVFAYTSVLYPLRTINKLIYSYSKQSLEITTYTPFGGLASREVIFTVVVIEFLSIFL